MFAKRQMLDPRGSLSAGVRYSRRPSQYLSGGKGARFPLQDVCGNWRMADDHATTELLSCRVMPQHVDRMRGPGMIETL